MMTAVFTVIFGRLARLPTDHTPPVLFYLCGLLSWSYFAQTMPAIAGTFTNNGHLFGKIYFPRLTIPFAQLVGNLPALAIQAVTFGAMWGFIFFTDPVSLRHVSAPAAVGILIASQLQVMALSLGVGLILAAATGKYRDLQHILPVLVQLWFYATPVVYPLSMISREANWRWVATLNPMTAPAEGFKLALLGEGSWSIPLALGAWLTTSVVLALGFSAFSRAERTVIDVT